jgi:hypothetical protein
LTYCVNGDLISIEVNVKERLQANKDEIPSELWATETKINGLANLLQSHNGQFESDEMDWYGIGLLLRDIANELQKMRLSIEKSSPEFGSDSKSKKIKAEA